MADLTCGIDSRSSHIGGGCPPGCQVLLLVHLRRNETFAGLAAVFGVGVANAHREVTEVWTCWPSCRLTL